MKIIDINAWVVGPGHGALRHVTGEGQRTFVTIDTDEGLQDWGEASREMFHS